MCSLIPKGKRLVKRRAQKAAREIASQSPDSSIAGSGNGSSGI
jgi:hypothetical protein